MKRLLVITTVVALGGVLALCERASAQTGGQPQAGATRVGVVNIYTVMKNYKKVEMLNETIKTEMAPLEKKMKESDEQLQAWQKIFADPKTDTAKKEEARKNVTAYKRYLEDLVVERNKILMKRGEEQAVQVYREIEDAIQRFAVSGGYGLVLQYYEPTEVEDRYSAKNIRRKLHECSNAGACAPIFIGQGLDVSVQVLGILNSQVPNTAITPTSGNGG